MFTVSRNLFAALEDEEGDVVVPKPSNPDAKKDWSHLPWEQQTKKKKKQQQTKQESMRPNGGNMKAKPLILPDHVRVGPRVKKETTNGDNATKQRRVQDQDKGLGTVDLVGKKDNKSGKTMGIDEFVNGSAQRQRSFTSGRVGRGPSTVQEEEKKKAEPVGADLNLGDADQFPCLRSNVRKP